MKLLYEEKTDIRLTYPKGVDFPPHLHNALEIVFLLEGFVAVISGRERLEMRSGDVFIAFPNQIHGYENSRDFKGFVLIVPAKPYLSAYRSFLEQKLPENPVLHPPEPVYTQLLTLLQLALPDRKTASAPLIQGYAFVLISKLFPLLTLVDAPTGNDALQSVLRYISEHYTQPLSRGDIARAVGYSESYISHIFKDCLNTNLTEYLTMLRMDEARQLLRDTDLPVSRIAMTLGFSSIRSFNRYFAIQMHMTPTAYRGLRR